MCCIHVLMFKEWNYVKLSLWAFNVKKRTILYPTIKL